MKFSDFYFDFMNLKFACTTVSIVPHNKNGLDRHCIGPQEPVKNTGQRIDLIITHHNVESLCYCPTRRFLTFFLS